VIYETEADRQREWDIAMVVAIKASCTLVRAPQLACYDFLAIRKGDLAAILEVKYRTHAMDAYETLILSKAKVDRLRSLGGLLQVPVILVVSFDGMVATANISGRGSETLVQGGRTDRRDPADVESCWAFPMDRFTAVR
jgi:hypothetical protein